MMELCYQDPYLDFERKLLELWFKIYIFAGVDPTSGYGGCIFVFELYHIGLGRG